jgi:hypothetical protein
MICPGRVARLRYLTDLGADLGAHGTMLFGGQTTYHAWAEARSSFIHGNYVATIVLCQSLAENLLAAFLHGGPVDDLPPRIHFDETLRRCRASGLLIDQDLNDLKKLTSLRNPLTHFRDLGDKHNLDRRSMITGAYAADLLRTDA